MALFEYIVESDYDKLKTKTTKVINELFDMNRDLAHHKEVKIKENNDEINAIKESINNQANMLIELIKANQAKLIHKADRLAENVAGFMDVNYNMNEHVLTKLNQEKALIENNELNEKQLQKIPQETTGIREDFGKLIDQVDAFKESTNFVLHKELDLKQLFLGDITSTIKKSVFILD